MNKNIKPQRTQRNTEERKKPLYNSAFSAVILFSLFFLLFSLFSFPLFAQAGVSLEAEIQSIERAAAKQGISAVERHDALVRLARLRQLSGNVEGAARNWLEAAAAIPGQVDDDALLSCAYCLAAMGEWDRARKAIEPLLVKNTRARFLDICINAIRTGDNSTLVSIADGGEYSQLKSVIYFILWKLSKGEAAASWRSRLISEFPQSPEGLLAAGGTPAVIMKTSPFWLFITGLDSLPLMETAERPQSPSAAAAPAPQTSSAPPPQPLSPQTSAAQPASQPPAASSARLQTGIFSREENAGAQMAGLRQAGFSPSLEQRGDKWVVTVPVGSDYSRTVKELKDKGFDAFLVRN